MTTLVNIWGSDLIVPGHGLVLAGNTIALPDDLAQALVTSAPHHWQIDSGNEPEPEE